MDPAEALAMQDRKRPDDHTAAPAAADWLENPTTPSERPLTQAQKWAAEPQWVDPNPEPQP